MLPSAEMTEFCRIDCDRFFYIKNWLDRENLNASVISTGELKHFLIRPGGDKSYHSGEYIKTLIAHYDRYPGSPGANDNSASVFQLLSLCRFLKDTDYSHNCQILLTDGEELHHNSSTKEQGSYRLAELFKERGLSRTVIIILDMCGIGDTMVYSTGREKLTGEEEVKESKLLDPIIKLIPTYSRHQSLLHIERFSDDLGFIAHNFHTLQISLIPWKEKEELNSDSMPLSWQTMHTPHDLPDNLESYSFRIMEGFLKALSKVIIRV
jgi:hypothetical protein